MLSQINFKAIVEDLYEGLYVVDRERRIQYWNKAAEKLTGFAAAEVIGSRCADNILMHIDRSGQSLCQGQCPLAATMTDGDTREAEVFLHHKSGHRVPVLVRTTPLRDSGGNIDGGIEIFSDDSPRQTLRQEIDHLKHLSLIDDLTELPNRRYTEIQINHALSLMDRVHVPFGVIFFDIDHFKKFNDTHGHSAGDLALRVTAETFKHTIRSFDTIGRWGGEEFLGVFPNMNRQTLQETGNRLRRMIKHSRVQVGKQALGITISAGGVLAAAGDTRASLVEKADAAMYRSKKSGRDRFTLHQA
ncbi:MAG: diguanylate cyclase [Desulfosudaceae bacterium]